MFTLKLKSSVGKGGANRAEDVSTVQELLNICVPATNKRLVVDGSCGPKTIVAIETFQKGVLKPFQAGWPSGSRRANICRPQ